MKLILASASPRRKEILENAGFHFEIIPSDCEENVPNTLSPDMMVTELAILKATDVASKQKGDLLIVGADTLVAFGDTVMGKPKDAEDASKMLHTLSGQTHQVYTGICVIRRLDGFMVAKSEKTDITFRSLSEKEIEDYIATGEPFDKAGAYAIQGLANPFVSNIEGDFNNVVGFPLDTFIRILKDEFHQNIPSKEHHYAEVF